jgi:hypothetical protein
MRADAGAALHLHAKQLGLIGWDPAQQLPTFDRDQACIKVAGKTESLV